LAEILQYLLLKFPLFQIKMDEFNYLQFLNDGNDLFAAEQFLGDDFPTFDVSFNQIVADFSLNMYKYCCSSEKSPVHRNQNHVARSFDFEIKLTSGKQVLV